MGTRRRLVGIVAVVTAGLVGSGFVALADEGGSTAARRSPAGAEFISALAERDFAAAQATLAPEIEFKGFTPSMGFFDRKGSAAVMSLMREWYATSEGLESLETYDVVKRHHVGYRVRWRSNDGPMVFEQQAFYDLDDAGRIRALQLVCSGDQPVA